MRKKNEKPIYANIIREYIYYLNANNKQSCIAKSLNCFNTEVAEKVLKGDLEYKYDDFCDIIEDIGITDENLKKYLYLRIIICYLIDNPELEISNYPSIEEIFKHFEKKYNGNELKSMFFSLCNTDIIDFYLRSISSYYTTEISKNFNAITETIKDILSNEDESFKLKFASLNLEKYLRYLENLGKNLNISKEIIRKKIRDSIINNNELKVEYRL